MFATSNKNDTINSLIEGADFFMLTCPQVRVNEQTVLSINRGTRAFLLEDDMSQGYRKDGSKFGFQKGNKVNLGRKFSANHCKNISVARKGIIFTVEHRKNIGKAGIGRIPWNKGLKGFMAGENSPSWKGGMVKDSRGYILIYNPQHPNSLKHKYVRRSRLVVEKYLNRYLEKKEVVHHINKIPDDDRIENLMVFKNNGSHKNFERKFNLHSKYIIFDGRKIKK